MLRRGWTRKMVAEKFGLHQSQIDYDWRIVHEELKGNRDRDYDRLISVRLEQYAETMREAWAEHEKSKVATLDKDGNEKPREPSDRWLRVVVSCLDSMCDLQGLAVPKRKDVTDSDTSKDPERYLEEVLPHVKRALEILHDNRRSPEVIANALPAMSPTVRIPDEQVVETRDDLPIDEEFSLEDFLMNTNGRGRPLVPTT
ncbi:MAG: hypothetical protein K8T89_22105 [Planctomycetes bacterium]|nr:hypothetical protein [Planctomycetota bacterium]